MWPLLNELYELSRYLNIIILIANSQDSSDLCTVLYVLSPSEYTVGYFINKPLLCYLHLM